MKHQFIPLDENRPDVYLETFTGDLVGQVRRTAMLVIPGGGYSCICSDREGEPIALAFLAHGIQSFVLHYSVGDAAKFPEPLIEASKAVAYIRSHADEYGILPDRVFACGFSAGGHLCASLGTMWYYPEVITGAGIQYGDNKIAGMIPVYAVVSYETQGKGDCTFDHVFGTDDPTEEQNLHWSPVHAVSDKTVPAYIVHTAADQTVPVDNCLQLARALAQQGIRFELHVYQDGPHGIALANEITECGNPQWINPAASHWVDNAFEWMNRQK